MYRAIVDAARAAPQRLHRQERSTVTVGFLIMAVTLYLCVAGVWNTGVLVDQKIQTQVYADAVAHTAATSVSSSLNQMAMLNMLVLRSRSAQAVGTNCTLLSTAGNIAAFGLLAMYIARIFASMGLDAEAIFQATVLSAWDIPRLIAFTAHHAKASRGEINRVYDNCRNMQRRVLSQLVSNINARTREIEDYLPKDSAGGQMYRVYLAHPKGELYPGKGASAEDFLFRKSSYGNRISTFTLRLVFADIQWGTVGNPYSPPNPGASYALPAMRSQKFFSGFQSSLLPNILRVIWYGGLVAEVFIHSDQDWGYELLSRSGLSEWDGGSASDRSMMQVVAVVERSASSQTFMARGFFKPLNKSDSVVAVAQAEAGNVYDELLFNVAGDIPIVRTILKLPWRMWSSMGANYQGRLAELNLTDVVRAMNSSPAMGQAWKNNTGMSPQDMQGLSNVFLH